METTIDAEAEQLVHGYSRELVAPDPGECLACYIERMLRQFGCDGTLRFALAFRDERAPRATALSRTLGDSGGYCDCEVLMNVYEPISEFVAPCIHVRRGSTRPCTLWRRWRRGYGALF